MKKLSSRTPRILSCRIAVCLVVLVVAAFCVVACSGDEMQYPSSEGYALSGKITLDDEGLDGVEIFVNGEKAGVSDDNGVFSLTGLSYGDEVAFLADGYSFSPSSYTVRGTVNDLGVRASVPPVTPVDDEPETPDAPEDGEDGPGDDGENDGEEENDPVPEKLPSPSVTVSVTQDSAAATILVDDRATAFTFSFADGSAVTVGMSDAAFTVGGHTFSFTRTETDGGAEITIDISPLKSAEGAAYTLVFAVSAQGFLPSDEVRAEVVFSPAAPAFASVNFDAATGLVSWTTENAPAGCTFSVYADGVLAGNTSQMSFDAGDALPSGEYTVVVVMLHDGIPAVVSQGIPVAVA